MFNPGQRHSYVLLHGWRLYWSSSECISIGNDICSKCFSLLTTAEYFNKKDSNLDIRAIITL